MYLYAWRHKKRDQHRKTLVLLYCPKRVKSQTPRRHLCTTGCRNMRRARGPPTLEPFNSIPTTRAPHPKKAGKFESRCSVQAHPTVLFQKCHRHASGFQAAKLQPPDPRKISGERALLRFALDWYFSFNATPDASHASIHW